jgi:hypothetical protein
LVEGKFLEIAQNILSSSAKNLENNGFSIFTSKQDSECNQINNNIDKIENIKNKVKKTKKPFIKSNKVLMVDYQFV